MNFKGIIKKQTTVIVIAVLMVTITAIGVSYSVFFDVKSNKANQVITAGNLEVTLSKNIQSQTPQVLATGEGLKSTPISYTLSNAKDNLPASYKVYVSVETANVIDTNKIMVSTDGNVTAGTTAQNLTTLPKETSINGEKGNYYQISSGNINAGSSSETKYLRIWVNEGDTAFSGNVQLKLYVVSEVNEAAITN